MRPIHGDPVRFGVEGGEDDRCCGMCAHWCPGVGGQGMCEKQLDAVLEATLERGRSVASEAAYCIEDEKSDSAMDCPWYEERGF